MKSKEENSEDIFHNYVQVFGLWNQSKSKLGYNPDTLFLRFSAEEHCELDTVENLSEIPIINREQTMVGGGGGWYINKK